MRIGRTVVARPRTSRRPSVRRPVSRRRRWGWRRRACRRRTRRPRLRTSAQRSSRSPRRMAAHSAASSAKPRAASRSAWAIGLGRAEGQLPLDHREHVGRDPGVEVHPPVGRVGDVALQELPHGLHQAGEVGHVVGLGHGGPRLTGNSSSRSCSVSQTRRPMAASSTERRQPGQVGGGLHHADHPPLQGAEHLPPVQLGGVDRAAARRLVGGEQLLAAAEPAGRVGRAEAPRPHAEPAEVLDRVAEVGELPVEHRPQPVRADDEVAGAEVAVDHGGRAGGRAGSPRASAGRARWPGAAGRAGRGPCAAGRPGRRRSARAPRRAGCGGWRRGRRRTGRPGGAGRPRTRRRGGCRRASVSPATRSAIIHGRSSPGPLARTSGSPCAATICGTGTPRAAAPRTSAGLDRHAGAPTGPAPAGGSAGGAARRAPRGRRRTSPATRRPTAAPAP